MQNIIGRLLQPILNRLLIFSSTHNLKILMNFAIFLGADVNSTNDLGQTPMHIASIYGYDDIAGDLNHDGASINIKDNQQNLPLYYARKFNHKKIIDITIDKKIENEVHNTFDPNDVNSYNKIRYNDISYMRTRLLKAIYSNDAIELESCIREGADLKGFQSTRESSDIVSLIYSTFRYFTDKKMLMVFLKTASDLDFKIKDNIGNTGLHYACDANNPELLQILIANQLDVNALNIAGKSPISSTYNLECVKILIDYGAITNGYDVDKDGNTILHRICHHDISSELLYKLISVGTKINFQNHKKRTALDLSLDYFLSKKKSNLKNCKLLIYFGADSWINYKDTSIDKKFEEDLLELKKSLFARGMLVCSAEKFKLLSALQLNNIFRFLWGQSSHSLDVINKLINSTGNTVPRHIPRQNNNKC